MYHITQFKNLRSIVKNGLIANKCLKSHDSGPGVYLYKDLSATRDIIEYIYPRVKGPFIICEVIVPNEDKLLMDEDALGPLGEDLYRHIVNEFSKDIIDYYIEQLVLTNYNYQKCKILTINHFQLKPNKGYKTRISRSSTITARYDDNIPIDNIIKISGFNTNLNDYLILYQNGITDEKEIELFGRLNH